MIEVDESKLEQDDREFLALGRGVKGIARGFNPAILEAAIDGDQYIKMRPRD